MVAAPADKPLKVPHYPCFHPKVPDSCRQFRNQSPTCSPSPIGTGGFFPPLAVSHGAACRYVGRSLGVAAASFPATTLGSMAAQRRVLPARCYMPNRGTTCKAAAACSPAGIHRLPAPILPPVPSSPQHTARGIAADLRFPFKPDFACMSSRGRAFAGIPHGRL